MTIALRIAENGRLTYGNLNNQRIAFYAAIITCKHLNASLVMPRWHIGGSQYVHFSHLWDADNLLRQAAADGVTVVVPSFSEGLDCADGKMQDDLDTRMSLLNSGRQSTLCVKSYELFYELWKHNLTARESQNQGGLLMHTVVAESIQFAQARHWLKPSRSIEERAHSIVKALVKEDQDFYGIHVRTESDFVNACSAWEPRINGLRCWLGIHEYAAELEHHGIQQGSLLLIFPAQAPDSLSALCGAKYTCIHRDMVDPAHGLAYNEKALLDYAMAGHAAGAFGNIYSTMSVELVANARANGKLGAFLNTPCPKLSIPEGRCP